MADGIKKIIRNIFRPHTESQQDHEKIFSGSSEYLMENGRLLLEERISLFDGRTNPVRCFTADELNRITDFNHLLMDREFKCFQGNLDGRKVLVKVTNKRSGNIIREVAVATQMSTHKNVHNLLGCCLETKYPVLVYDWVEHGPLSDKLHGYSNENSPQQLEWKDSLRIAWEISHATAYLHTAFARAIVHRYLTPYNVYLDQENVAKVSNYALSVAIPKGKRYICNEPVVGTQRYIAPEYLLDNRLSEKSDVYTFGQICDGLSLWNPAINIDEDLREQLQELGNRCASTEEDNRPTMVDVATELRSIMVSFESRATSISQ